MVFLKVPVISKVQLFQLFFDFRFNAVQTYSKHLFIICTYVTVAPHAVIGISTARLNFVIQLEEAFGYHGSPHIKQGLSLPVREELSHLPLFFVRKHLLDLLRAQSAFAKYNTIIIIEESSYLFILLCLLIFVKIELNYVLILYLVNTLFIILLTLKYLKLSSTIIAYKVNLSYVREVMLYGLKIHAGNIFRTLNYRLDSLIVGMFFSLAVVGYYSIATSLVQTAMLIGYSIGTVILPVISKVGFADDKYIIIPILRVTIFISVLFCAAVYGFGSMFIKLCFGQAFIPAVEPLYIMAPTAIFTNVSLILSYYYVGTGRGVISSYSSVILVLTTAIFALLLIPHWGIRGAALAVTMSSLVQALYLFLTLKKDGSYGFGELLIPRKSDLMHVRKQILG